MSDSAYRKFADRKYRKAAKAGTVLFNAGIRQTRGTSGWIPRKETRHWTAEQVKVFMAYTQPKITRKEHVSPIGWSMWKLITLMMRHEGATTEEIRRIHKIRSYKNRIRTLRLMGYAIEREVYVFKEYIKIRNNWLVSSRYRIVSVPNDGYTWDMPNDAVQPDQLQPILFGAQGGHQGKGHDNPVSRVADGDADLCDAGNRQGS